MALEGFLIDVWLIVFGLYVMGWDGDNVPDVVTVASKETRRLSDEALFFLEIYRQQDRALLQDFEESLYVRYKGDNSDDVPVKRILRKLLNAVIPQASPYTGQCLFWTGFYNVCGNGDCIEFNRIIFAYDDSLREFMSIGKLPRELESVRRNTTVYVPFIDFQDHTVLRNTPEVVFEEFKVEGEESRMDPQNEFEE